MFRRSKRLQIKSPTARGFDLAYFNGVCATWKSKYDAALAEICLLNETIANCRKEIDALADEVDEVAQERDDANRLMLRIRQIIATGQLDRTLSPYDILTQVEQTLV